MFSGWGTLRGQKSNMKAFSHKVLYIYYSNFLKSVLAFIKQSKKMDFPLYFQILRGRVWFFFFKLGFFCQMASIYLLNSREGPQSLDLSSPLIVIPYHRQLNAKMCCTQSSDFKAAQECVRVKNCNGGLLVAC